MDSWPLKGCHRLFGRVVWCTNTGFFGGDTSPLEAPSIFYRLPFSLLAPKICFYLCYSIWPSSLSSKGTSPARRWARTPTQLSPVFPSFRGLRGLLEKERDLLVFSYAGVNPDKSWLGALGLRSHAECPLGGGVARAPRRGLARR